MRIFAIGAAGFLGAVSRYALARWVMDRAASAFPWGTLVVNVSGCFLAGFIIALTSERFAIDPDLRAALTIGFLGAYTTFSTFALDTMRLAESGAWLHAAANVLASVSATLIAVVLGTWAGRAL